MNSYSLSDGNPQFSLFGKCSNGAASLPPAPKIAPCAPALTLRGTSAHVAFGSWLCENKGGCRPQAERGLDPAVPRPFIIDGSKALARAIRRSFGRRAPIQRCQIHKARNIMERLPKPLHASVRRTLRQAWEVNDAGKAEKLIRNLAQRLERDAPGVSRSILEGLDEILSFQPSKLVVGGRACVADQSAVAGPELAYQSLSCSTSNPPGAR